MLIIGDFDPNAYPVVGGGKIRVFNIVVENGVERVWRGTGGCGRPVKALPACALRGHLPWEGRLAVLASLA